MNRISILLISLCFLLVDSLQAQPTTPPAGVGGLRPIPAGSSNAGAGATTPSAATPLDSPQAAPQNPVSGNGVPAGSAGSAASGGALVVPAAVPGTGSQDPQGKPQETAPATNQETPTVPTASELGGNARLTLETVQSTRDAALAVVTDEEQKKRLGELYQKAVDNLTQIQTLKQREAELTGLLGTVKERAEQARNRQELAMPSLELDNQALADVQAEASTLEQRVKTLRDEITDLTGQQATRLERRKELQTLIAAVPANLEALRMQLQSPAPDGETAAVTKARRTELQTSIQLLETRLPVLNLEREWLEAESANDVLRLQLDARRTELADKEKRLNKVNELLNQMRKQAADEAAEAAKREVEQVPASLQPLANENETLAKELVTVTENLNLAKAQNSELSKLMNDTQLQRTETQEKVDGVGLTDAIGHLLRKQRVELPTNYKMLQYRPEPETISAAQYSMIQYNEMRGDLVVSNADRQIFSEDGVRVPPSAEDARLAKKEAELLEKKQDLLNQLHQGFDEYFEELIDLDTNQRRLQREVESYHSYIDERVLWIPSGKPIYRELTDIDSDLWFLSPRIWSDVGKIYWRDLQQAWAIWFIFIVFLVGLRYRAMEYRRRITSIGREASSGSATSFRPTLEVLLYTVLISLPWAALLIYLGWRLGVQTQEMMRMELLTEWLQAREGLTAEVLRDSMLAISTGTMAVGAALLPLETLRHTCREMGLGTAHFGWSSSTLLPINRLIRLMNAIGLPLVFVTTTLYAVDPTFGNDLLERVCFVIGTALLTYVVYRLLAPRNGILRNYYAQHAGGWLDRLQYVWFALALFMPVFLATLAVLGYYYTACQLSLRLYAMFWLVICLLVGRELVARMILVGRRRSYIEQARLRRAQLASQQTSNVEESEVKAAALVGSSKEWSESLSEQTKQSKSLLNSVVLMITVFGTWWIWADVVPALRVVYSQTLWTTTETVATPLEDGASLDEATTKEVIRNITPTDLLQAIVALAMTIVVFRNLPGLVDIMILNRLPLDPSTRNAITAICSYLVIVLGIIWAASAIGVHWTQVQWLVTALTFGLAFGLQEIFANFVAGVIILFERPIRVGDVVTVDDVTGIVTKTRARATTIRNWDLKEFIVPNKEFITGRVLNWTLTDQVTRLLIPVGVAYGSDTQLTAELLLRAAQENSLVLSDPAPSATFEAFGDSTLNFVLRAYVARLDDRLKVTSDLHRAIDNLFRENKIEIAFPQQDLHIRTIPPQWAPKARETSGPETEAT